MRVLPGLLIACLLWSADWPQWRGPARDGAVPQAPNSWPAALVPDWKIAIGEGHSSPIVAAGKIFVFSREKGEEVVRAVDPVSGKVLWRQAYPAPYSMHRAALRHGEGPKSTPAFYEGKLYTLGISGILSSFDAATGKPLWRKEFSREHKQTSPLYGAAMSPVVDHGLLIAHVGGHDGGALTAFDAVSGSVQWSWKGDGPGYSSPMVAELGGRRQVITQTQQQIVSLTADSGAVVWSLPFTTPYSQNSVTPYIYSDTVILSGLSAGVFAVRGGNKLWHNQEVSMYMNSPVVRGNLLFGFSHRDKGQLFCLDAATGKTKWIGEPRQGDNASLLLAGDHLLILTNEGELTVAKASGESFQKVRSYQVADSPTWAHPLVLDTGVVIKDLSTLALWRLR